jgi:hypothetical protein
MTLQRGKIDFANLNPMQGREQAGHRQVLVLSIDAINRLPLVVTGVGMKGENIPRAYPTNVRESKCFHRLWREPMVKKPKKIKGRKSKGCGYFSSMHNILTLQT